jgi:hypothetical protein
MKELFGKSTREIEVKTYEGYTPSIDHPYRPEYPLVAQLQKEISPRRSGR